VTPAGIAVSVPLFVATGGVAVYVIAKFLPVSLRRWTGALTALWLLAAFCLLLSVITGSSPGTMPFVGLTGGLLITGVGAVAALASQGSLDPKGPVHLYYPLFLLSLAGAVAIGFSGDLFTIFVTVELSAIPAYALCAYRYKEDPAALSSAMKYLIQGVAGTITALLGVAILYAEGHTLSLSELPGALAGGDQVLIVFAALLILIGYGVKLAIFPLHTWLPDAYSRAPAGVTAIMTGATKIGVLIALFLSLSALPGSASVPRTIGIVVTFFAVITMTAGNLLALNQRDLRRVLAYSSVAQMGYILLGFGIGLLYSLPFGFAAGLFYAVAYGVMKSGAFIAADAFTERAGSSETAQMKGLGAKNPLLGISFTVIILGLIGQPFTCGFLGKLLVIQSGIATFMWGGIVLGLILELNTGISLGYYVPILSILMFPGGKTDQTGQPAAARPGIPLSVLSAVVVLAIATLYLGIFPEPFYSWISHAAAQIFTWGVA
jgi:proton-translocating NADH-quinone oxidoreductase chain N